MDFSEILTSAKEALALNKLRTALATLGVIIGIASVIALVSLGQASQMAVQAQIQSLGSNLLTVMPGAQTTGGVRQAAGGMTTLTYEDAKAISGIASVKGVSAELSRRGQITALRNNTNTQVLGVTPDYFTVRKVALGAGSFLSQKDVDGMGKVAVLGPQVVTDLFGEGANPIGETIRINRIAFRVIGTSASKGGSGFMNQDDMVFIPLTTAQKQLFGVSNIGSVSVEAKSEAVMEEARNEIGYLLLARHKLSDPAQADFSILSQEDILGAAAQVTGTFTALLSGIAAISLLVGGIGIMNIMFVTVTERTREIGLRKALGAKKRWIILQFLTESVLLTIAGGILGMMLGIGLSFLIGRIINLPFTISLFSVFLAVGVSGGIGILFGWYPARKAASLNPIEALRYE
ncbi:MAG: ABC transporter permease [bacterium]|nr:ABC transporter permease [bacterium]